MLDGARLDPRPAPAFNMTAAEWMAPDYDEFGLFA